MKSTFFRSLQTLLVVAAMSAAPLAYAQSFDDDYDDDFEDDYEEVAVSDAAVSVYTAKVSDKCECDPESLTQYEKCLKKWEKKTSTAFQKASKFAGESYSDLKSLLRDETDSLVSDCEYYYDDPEDDYDDYPDDEFDDFE